MKLLTNNDIDRLLRHSHHDHDDSEHEHDHGGTQNITSTKIICMVLLGVGSFVSGNLPLLFSYLQQNKKFNSENELLNAKRRRKKIISVLLAFTGGVLFSTIFLHLLPEVGEMFEELLHEDAYKQLPEYSPQALVCFGFFVMYFVEVVAHKLMHSGKESESKSKINHTETKVTQLNYSTNNSQTNNEVDGEKISTFIKNVINITEEASKNLSFEDRQKIINCVRNATSSSDVSFSGPHFVDLSNPVRESSQKGCNNGDIYELELVSSTRSSIRSFLLALALSVHALFEGMAIGLEKRSTAVWLMLIGVGSHKVLLSVCMGIEMVAGNINKLTHILYVTMFAVVSPLGMGAGVIVSTEHDTLAAIFQGIAGGTLLYVLFYEVLKSNGEDVDENSVESGFMSFFAILCGFLIMAAFQTIAE